MTRFACAAFLLLLWLLSTAFLYNRLQEEEQTHFKEDNRLLATIYRASVAKYRLATEILFREVIQRPEVVDTFAEGVHGDEATARRARGKLYRQLAHAYDQLTGQGIQELQFHTADGLSFLRFHAPDRFSDTLSEIRPSIRIANTQKHPSFGFECGRLSIGFRYVFPLFRGTQHLGSVETGVTIRKINEAMSEIDPEREYLLIFRKSIMENALLQERLFLYTASPITDEFLVENSIRNFPGSPQAPSSVVETLSAWLKEKPSLRNGLDGRAFSVPAKIESEDWLVSFEPVNDPLGRNVAYVVSYTKAPYMADLRNDFFRNLLFSSLALSGLFWLTLRLMKVHNSLKLKNRQLQVITDTIGDGLFVINPQGHITQINPAFTEILGYRADEILGRAGHAVFHCHVDGRTFGPADECPLVKAAATGTGFIGEEVFRHKEGRLLTVDLTCKPILSPSFMDGSVVVFRDITDRKNLEERLLESNRVKNEFMANMSHELRTPMAVFMSAIEHLKEIDEDPQHQQLLDLADRASQQLYLLISDILDFSKLEGQRLVIESAPFSLRDCLDEILSRMLDKANSKDLRLSLNVSPDIPESFTGDRYRLGQALANLTDNAIKFSNAGEVTISVRRQQDGVEFSVTDTGIGIPEEKLGSIFDMFTQVDGSTTRHYGGTGLGLAITSKLVELMGGRLHVQSRLGEGSVFSFCLPLNRGDSARQLFFCPKIPGVRIKQRAEPHPLSGNRVRDRYGHA